jgi:hypothetical protein
MLAWVRGRLRPLALALLVALVGVGGATAATHGPDCREDQCGALLPHDGSSHRVGSPITENAHALYCVLCHWTRSLRPSTESAHHLDHPAADEVLPATDVPGCVSLVQAAQPQVAGSR